jgi:hypothetical protein
MSILSIYLDKRQNHVRIEVQAKPKAEASSKRPRKWCRALSTTGVKHGPDLATSWGLHRNVQRMVLTWKRVGVLHRNVRLDC